MFYDDDADLHKLDGKTVAIIGYGSQGHAHALNLKESGVSVRVGLAPKSKSAAKAKKAGLTVGSVADESKWQMPTTRRPSDAQWNDLRFAWAAVGSVKSNAILIAREEAAIGIGAGQMSRVDASFLAVHKARQQGHDPAGAVMASDAFFPFRDGVDEAAAAGISAIIQPGGSVKDNEVIAAADEHGIAMILTGMRQFRH